MIQTSEELERYFVWGDFNSNGGWDSRWALVQSGPECLHSYRKCIDGGANVLQHGLTFYRDTEPSNTSGVRSCPEPSAPSPGRWWSSLPCWSSSKTSPPPWLWWPGDPWRAADASHSCHWSPRAWTLKPHPLSATKKKSGMSAFTLTNQDPATRAKVLCVDPGAWLRRENRRRVTWFQESHDSCALWREMRSHENV